MEALRCAQRLSPTPVGVGGRKSFIWAGDLSLQESGYARLHVRDVTTNTTVLRDATTLLRALAIDRGIRA